MQTVLRVLLIALLFQALLAAGCNKKNTVATAHDPAYIDAQELKLKIRELADQMLATTDNSRLYGLVAMPTSFVNLDNKAQTSAFGNLISESLIYEFNQRGFPVREYRLTGNIDVVLRQGDFALLRQGLVSTEGKWAALVVGTYYRDKDAVFVNARLVRAHDGLVLRTGQLVLVNTPLIARLSLPNTPPSPPAPTGPTLGLSTGVIEIKQAPWEGKDASKTRGPGLWGAEPYYYQR